MVSQNKNRLLVIGERFYPEEFLINDVVDFWIDHGINVSILTQYPSYPQGKVYENYPNKLFGIDHYKSALIYRVKTIEGYKNSKFLKVLNYLAFVLLGSIKAVQLAKKTDTVFVYQTGPLTQAIPAIILKKLFRKKLIIWTWDIWPDTVYSYGFKKTKLKSFVLDRFVSSIYKNADKILISSPGFSDTLSKYAAQKKIEVIPNWIKPLEASLVNNIDFKKDSFHFLFAGNVGKVQNLQNVIKGFHIARTMVTKINLHIVGDGSDLVELKSFVKSDSIQNVHFWGRFSESETTNFYHKTDFLIISLKADDVYEKYVPSKFQTYLKAGKPILCAMKGTVSHIVQKEQLGYLADPAIPEKIADAFLALTKLSNTQKQEIYLRSNQVLNANYNRMKNLNRLLDIVNH